jgi:hypothetical protein
MQTDDDLVERPTASFVFHSTPHASRHDARSNRRVDVPSIKKCWVMILRALIPSQDYTSHFSQRRTG